MKRHSELANYSGIKRKLDSPTQHRHHWGSANGHMLTEINQVIREVKLMANDFFHIPSIKGEVTFNAYADAALAI